MDTLRRIGLPNGASRIAVLAVGAFVFLTALSIDVASAVLIGSKDWVVDHFDRLFTLVASLSLLVVMLLGVVPRANVRMGPDDARPEFGALPWFAMLFSAGLASGLLYWAAAEPILHYQGNPFADRAGIAPSSEAAVLTALRITIFHWGLHGWAFYVLAAVSIGVCSHRYGRPLSFRSALVPLLGPRWIDRWPGLAIDLVALFGTVCGVATSIGLASAGMNATLQALVGLPVSVANQILVVFFACGLGIVSALSGIARGIRRLSELNVWISLALLAVVLGLGQTGHLLALFATALGDYFTAAVPMGFWTAGSDAHRVWQSEWTVFYWGWWLAWMPFVSLFIARISKGRTVREFVLAVLLVPTLVIVIWMVVFGGTALQQEIASPGAVSVAVNQDYSMGIVQVIQNLASGAPGTGLIAVAAFLLFTWLITSLDSATLVICHLLGTGEVAATKIFWGLALAAVTCALIMVGGLQALQAASIVIGLPMALVAVAIAVGIMRELAVRPR